MSEASPFQKLLADFAALTGAETDQIVTALEFEFGKHVVKVLPHPGKAEDCIIEVEVGVLAEPLMGAASMAALDMPESASGNDSWSLLLLGGERMVLKKTISVLGTTAHDLESLISEALDKVEEIHSGHPSFSQEQTIETITNPLNFA